MDQRVVEIERDEMREFAKDTEAKNKLLKKLEEN
jgi:hypothetical protein